MGFSDIDVGDDLTTRQKAAILLVAVGPAEAAAVLEHMSDEEVELVATEISKLGSVAPELIDQVIDELRTTVVTSRLAGEGGLDYARTMLVQWKGDRGEEIIERLRATAQIAPFRFLSKLTPEQLLTLLKDEHPQTVALVLAHLPARFSARLLVGLTESLQTEVAWRIATLDRTAPEVVRRVEDNLRLRMGSMTTTEEPAARGGASDLAEVLNSAGRTVERRVLEELSESDPELAERVRALMFVFEDIVELADRDVQEVLRSVDSKQLALATKGVPEAVKEKVLGNLSERAASTLREEMEFLGPVRIADVEAAQAAIVAEIRRLDEEGTISMRGGADAGLIE